LAESNVHADIKNDVLWLFLSQESFAETEKKIGGNRTDVCVEVCGFPLAIEVQKSYISPEAVLYRMREHTKKGYHTIWIFPDERITRWKLFIQKIQNGVVFFYQQGQIRPARMDNVVEFRRNEIIATDKKYVDYYERGVDFDELIFEEDDLYNLKTVSFDPWWVETYLDLIPSSRTV